MRNEYADGLYVLTATKNGVTEQWAAATYRKEAAVGVQLEAGSDWLVKMMDLTISITKSG